MRGAVLYGPHDVRFEERAAPAIVEPTDAVIRLSAPIPRTWPPAPANKDFVMAIREDAECAQGHPRKSARMKALILDSLAPRDSRVRNRTTQRLAVAVEHLHQRIDHHPADRAEPAHLLDAVRTGSRQTGATLGTELFAYYDAHPDVREAFFGAMHGLSMLVASEAPKVYDASAHREMCDVGGSAGTIAAGFLRANPQLTGTVLDRPEVVPMATQAISDAGLAGRCRAVAGDFFVDVPAADLYVVKHILHDWNDDQCRTLLGNIARSAKPGARVLVIEMVIPEDGSPSAAPLMDLNMLVLLPGRERTAGQYGELFAASGLRLIDVRPTHSPMQVVVAEKV